MLFDEITAHNGQVLEDTHAERQQRHIVEVDGQMVADKNQKGRQHGINKKAGNKNGVVKIVIHRRADTAEHGVQAGQQGHGKEFGIGNRNREGKDSAQHQTEQQTEKRRAELNSEIAKIDQLKLEVDQETEKMVATIGAEMQKEVAQINAATKLKVAEIDLEAAKVQAKITETKGAAEVKAKFAVENEEALGIKRRAAAFKDSSLWADLTFADALNSNVSIRVLHAGEGTLWTDLKNAAITLPKPTAVKSVQSK